MYGLLSLDEDQINIKFCRVRTDKDQMKIKILMRSLRSLVCSTISDEGQIFHSQRLIHAAIICMQMNYPIVGDLILFHCQVDCIKQ